MSDYCLYPNQCGVGMDCSPCYQKRIADLEARLAAAEADAERYRWLRGHSFLIKDAIHFGSGARQHKPELLDAAIDKARGQ